MDNKFFTTFLLKVAARCNINCDYCYEYRLADQTWKNKPARMSNTTLNKTIDRIEEHINSHQLSSISIIFHGGEPLLAGADFFQLAVSSINERLLNKCEVRYGMQTNGTLIDESMAMTLSELKIGVGVSLDGFKSLNDKHRLDFKGLSTFFQVEDALKILTQPKFSEQKRGILCVIQPESDPIELINWFRGFGDDVQIDFLLPHYNHERKPVDKFNEVHGYGYGLWLVKLFDYWWKNDFDFKIRIFEDLMHLMIGGKYAVESFGLAPVKLVVVQTDGEYEAVDSLKSTYHGAVSTAKNIIDHSFDDLMGEYLVASRMDRYNNLSEICQSCRYVKVCGGGYIPHRYHPDLGFNAPSIYCQDLLYLIDHIEQNLLVSLDDEMKSKMNENLSSKYIE